MGDRDLRGPGSGGNRRWGDRRRRREDPGAQGGGPGAHGRPGRRRPAGAGAQCHPGEPRRAAGEAHHHPLCQSGARSPQAACASGRLCWCA